MTKERFGKEVSVFGFEGMINLHKEIILDSSMVEHSAVNRGVVGSSPTRGALQKIFCNLARDSLQVLL